MTVFGRDPLDPSVAYCNYKTVLMAVREAESRAATLALIERLGCAVYDADRRPGSLLEDLLGAPKIAAFLDAGLFEQHAAEIERLLVAGSLAEPVFVLQAGEPPIRHPLVFAALERSAEIPKAFGAALSRAKTRFRRALPLPDGFDGNAHAILAIEDEAERDRWKGFVRAMGAIPRDAYSRDHTLLEGLDQPCVVRLLDRHALALLGDCLFGLVEGREPEGAPACVVDGAALPFEHPLLFSAGAAPERLAGLFREAALRRGDAEPSGQDFRATPAASDRRNRVYLAAKDPGTRRRVFGLAERLGWDVDDACVFGGCDLPIEFPDGFARLYDVECGRGQEAFIRSWYADTDDETPSVFLGGWAPSFSHPSLVDAAGLSDGELARFLLGARARALE